MTRLLALLIAALLALAPTVAVDAQQTTSTTADAPNVADEPLPDPDATSGGSTWLLVLMAIIVVVMVVLAVAFVRGRRPPV